LATLPGRFRLSIVESRKRTVSDNSVWRRHVHRADLVKTSFGEIRLRSGQYRFPEDLHLLGVAVRSDDNLD